MGPGLFDFHGADMRSPPENAGVLAVLEPAREVKRRQPALVADLSGRGLSLAPAPVQHIHGSYLVHRPDVLLFGPNNLVATDGTWTCEARDEKRQFIWYLHEEFYDRMYPGPKPVIDYKGPWLRLHTNGMAEADIVRIDTPVFLATALEPPIWGRWIVTVLAKAFDFHRNGAGRKFFCYAALDWQKAFLRLLGIGEDRLLQHDPGRTHICRDVMTVEYSLTNMTINARERADLYELVARFRAPSRYSRKLFVSRLSRSRINPHYRVLQNELQLAGMLAELGFDLIEPEYLSFAEQIAAFGAAEQVICIGGSGLFNAVFCAPGTSIVSIESSANYIGHHAELLASLDLRYGVIFGEEDQNDPSPWHRRWTLNIPQTRAALVSFFG